MLFQAPFITATFFCLPLIRSKGTRVSIGGVWRGGQGWQMAAAVGPSRGSSITAVGRAPGRQRGHHCHLQKVQCSTGWAKTGNCWWRGGIFHCWRGGEGRGWGCANATVKDEFIMVSPFFFFFFLIHPALIDAVVLSNAKQLVSLKEKPFYKPSCREAAWLCWDPCCFCHCHPHH